jgi:DNA-binding transcriptional ArsR family regulator
METPVWIGLDGHGLDLILKYMLNYQTPLDLTFQALADPARRSIVERLTKGPASVSELAKPLPMSLPAVMLHLKVLEDSGLVKSQKVGRVRTCRIEAQSLSQAERWIAERRQMWERNLDRLGAFLDDTKPEQEP